MSTDSAPRPLDLKEIIELLIKHYGFNEGLYDVGFELSVGFGSVGPSKGEALPGAVFGIKAVGLNRVTEPGPHTVDAAAVNPAPPKRPKRAPPMHDKHG